MFIKNGIGMKCSLIQMVSIAIQACASACTVALTDELLCFVEKCFHFLLKCGEGVLVLVCE